jgi:hypothetical protein
MLLHFSLLTSSNGTGVARLILGLEVAPRFDERNGPQYLFDIVQQVLWTHFTVPVILSRNRANRIRLIDATITTVAGNGIPKSPSTYPVKYSARRYTLCFPRFLRLESPRVSMRWALSPTDQECRTSSDALQP